jgi:hypothetical protein
MKGIFFIFMFISGTMPGQRNYQPDSLTVQKKNAVAKEIGLDQLLTFYLCNPGSDPREPKILQYHKDPVYTYFILSGKSYKTLTSEVSKFDVASLKSDSLRRHFYDHVIPGPDKEKDKKCMTAAVTPTYKCYYVDKESIKISCHYNVICDMVPLLNRMYMALYNFRDKTFTVLPPPPVNMKK